MPTTLTPGRWTKKPTFGAKLNPSHPLSKGLVASWLLNEGGGVTAYDLVGFSHATLVGSPQRVSRTTQGPCVNIGGVSTREIKVTNQRLDVTGDLTMEAWVYPTSYTGLQAVILREDTTTGNAGRQYGFFLNGSGSIIVDQNGSEPVASVSPNYSLNVWNHIAVVINASTIVIYINGVQAYSGASTGVGQTSNPSAILSLGAEHNAGTLGSQVSGLVGKASVYSRALTYAEVKALYREPYSIVHAPSNSLLINSFSDVIATATAARLCLLGVG